MSDTNHPDALPPQYKLHWYVLEQVLGQGGFGITYLARDTNLEQRVAIKEYLPVDVATRKADATVRPRTGDQSERYRWGLERFIREARTLARFDHPNIVRVLSVFEFNNTAYMVMRFEEGENLASLLDRRRTLPEAELMRIVLPILDGLELVHGAGFIHRDIKPDNIHLRADGTPVLLDFGSARHSLGHARTVTILVAPGYAPFEQYYSTGESQGPWTDIYGLGATCYRAIAGVPPMDAIARSKGVLGSTREVLVPASAIGSGRYSPQLLKAIDHALEFAEKDRPQSVAEWRRELTGVKQAASAPKPAAQPAATPPAGAPASSAKGPILWAVLGAVVAAVAVVVWMRPPADSKDSKRIEELEKRIEQQKQEAVKREEDARKQAELERQRSIEASKREEEARRQAELKRQEEERQRLEAQKKPVKAEPPKRVTKASPTTPEPKPVAVAPEPPPTPAPKPVAEPAPKEEVAVAVPKKPAERVVPKDDAEAFNLYRKDALAGDAEAQLKLGEMYEAGRGVAQSNNMAYVWFSVAARRGNAAARPKFEQTAKKLQPAERQQADRLVDRLAGPAK